LGHSLASIRFFFYKVDSLFLYDKCTRLEIFSLVIHVMNNYNDLATSDIFNCQLLLAHFCHVLLSLSKEIDKQHDSKLKATPFIIIARQIHKSV
jgi:hypothetical protein